jgi:hypothetical protein
MALKKLLHGQGKALDKIVNDDEGHHNVNVLIFENKNLRARV